MKASETQTEKKVLSSHEVKKLAKINIKKQLQELENAIKNFGAEKDEKIGFIDEIEGEDFEVPELIENENKPEDENAEISRKWEKIKNVRVSAVAVDKKTEKNYLKNKLPLILAEYEQSIAMLLGAPNFYELPVSWRVRARFKAFNDAHVSLSEEQANKVRHMTLVEHKSEEYKKNKQKIITAETIKSGKWRWFALTSIVHTVFLVMLWSMILVEAQSDDPSRVSFFDPNIMPTEIEKTTVEPRPNEIEDDEDPIEFKKDPFPEAKKDNEEKRPEIPAIYINPSALNSKENREMKSELPAMTENRNLGISVGTKGGDEEGEDVVKKTMAGHRTGAGKQDLLAKHGGSEKTANAVKLGLKWLAAQQRDNGSWYASDVTGTAMNTVEGYTALALLCFLGDGNTEYFGEYKETVLKAVKYLISKQSSATGVISTSVYGMLYNHSIATLALSEYYAMTRREDMIEPIKLALKFLYNSQQETGGWDYTSNKLQNRTDMSITGWVVMAYNSVMSSGIPIKRESWEGAYKGVKSLLKDDGAAYYSINGNVYPYRSGLAMTAVSILCRLYARVPSTDRLVQKSLRWLKSNPPKESKLRSRKSEWGQVDYRKLKNDDDFFHTTYYWYYGTLSMFMVTNGVGSDWAKWNNAMKKAILGYQITKKNAFQGSWDPKEDFWGEIGGRLYATCLNILNLEIYYRYLPLYSKEEHMLRFGDDKPDDEIKNPDDDEGEELITSISEAASIINDSTKSDGEKIIAITYLKLQSSDDALTELVNVLWNEKVSEMIRWRVVGMLVDFPTKDFITGALIDAYYIDFNENLRKDILMTLAKLKRKNSLLFVAGKLDTSEDEEIRKEALSALESITTSRFGFDKTSWKTWINSNFE